MTPFAEELSKELADAQFALNRAMGLIEGRWGEDFDSWSTAQQLDWRGLANARDHVWGLRKALDPELVG